ncbi:sigma-70 family RNA polymerase sigma factor [Caulobacter sp. BE254]|uniref:sigma-70 family RNA polymerase sigma factor n=1 Tax=Caulobacter sp. BE254 TaxID=2817720 RepID=UPI00286733F1|nr:sigma-70 family RNA polymerase sigma factor [Caulobacter sp. BE254]MDR7115607.1 RNA polymerase sigma-70 factor (ECF subfamily) [Caulobacter sp. BE254]
MTDQPRDFEAMLSAMRPTLHRYCARMTGSVVDGEDVVQDALLKALMARETVGPLANPEGWLFRIAHNTALDFLRRRQRTAPMGTEEDLAMVAAPDRPDPDIAAASLRTFLRLPALQRSTVILKDVLGHSLEEISAITGATEAAAKSALQRGRVRLRELAREPEDVDPPVLSEAMRARLVAYVDGFKAGDFEAVRAMLADDVRLDLVTTSFQRRGKGEVGQYYGAYEAAGAKWAFAPATIDGRAAMLVYERAVSLVTPAYVVVLDFEDGQVRGIQDFLYARYVMEGATVHLV